MPLHMLRDAQAAAYGGDRPGNRNKELGEERTQGTNAHIQKKKQIPSGTAGLSEKFRRGDSVMIFPDKKIAIVCEPVNEKGVLRVQLPDKKIYINHKRVKLHVAADELYPEDYDLSIIFDTVENRKARHQMERKYMGDLVIGET